MCKIFEEQLTSGSIRLEERGGGKSGLGGAKSCGGEPRSPPKPPAGAIGAKKVGPLIASSWKAIYVRRKRKALVLEGGGCK